MIKCPFGGADVSYSICKSEAPHSVFNAWRNDRVCVYLVGRGGGIMKESY